MYRKEVYRQNNNNLDPCQNLAEYDKIYDTFYRKKIKELRHESSIFESVTFLNNINYSDD